MEKENKITYVKGTYIWSFDKNYESKIKMIKSVDGNIKLQNMTIFKDDVEYILKPRCIINDPFDEENSILLSCDIINLENECNNYDGRMTFLKKIQYFGKEIKENDSKISFIQKFKITTNDIEIREIANTLIKYCISCNIEIDEIDIDNNIIEINNKITNVLSACDELYFIRYIFREISLRNKFTYELYDNLSYKFTDEKTLGTDGIEFINNYLKKLNQKHSDIKKEELVEKYVNNFEISENPNKTAIFIPKSTKLTKNGYFIDNRFVADTDPYTVIFSNLNEIYS